MRFLHTGDIHLTPEAPVRFEALKAVCGMADELECDALLIAGDLFDSVEAASEMRGEVRRLFDSLPYYVCLIPGNHDAGAFSCGQYYGSNVLSAGDEPGIWEIRGVPVIALPFAPGRAAYESLCSLSLQKEARSLVVLAHASFYSFASARIYRHLEDDAGCGEAYFWDRDFADFPPAYVALGHWHNPTLPPLRVGQALVAYSGTPYPLTRGETGPRKALLVDVDGDGIRAEGIEIPGIPRRERAFFWFLPGYEEKVIQEIRRYLSEAADPGVILDVDTGGWLGDLREEAVVGELTALVAQWRHGWKEVNLGTPQFTAVASLSGFGRKCLELLREIEPPDACEIEDFVEPCLRLLAEEVLEEREELYRQALSFVLRYLGK